ncbi:MAG TPA: 4-alpha-glucanotransferase [Planctomycetota bacterium]|nr:4-alpha-glucanotransferase [Planctomycetota bacterium]
MKRSSGILLHITSLPGRHGIGDLGEWAYRWVDLLAAGKQSYWQILPLGPTGFGNSPYASPSAYAGNPLLISLDELVKDGLLQPEQLDPYESTRPRVNFEKVKRFKFQHLFKAFENFTGGSDLDEEYEKFCDESHWLESYAKFGAKREQTSPEFVRFEQFIFSRQWSRLKTYTNQKGVQIVGDLPMYVSEDSVDRLDYPQLFDLESGFCAGAPPCPVHLNGQKWGNPLYRWERHRETGYQWWMDRVRATLKQCDVVRLDYFCGYATFWATNGHQGHWRRGPGHDLFHCAREKLGNITYIAEDLGELTHEIHELRDRWGIMSSKIMQYAFDGQQDNPYVPENYRSSNCVVYTGTHDNDTCKGWYEQAPEYVKENVRRAAQSDGRDISWDMIKLAAQTKADLLMVQFQDVLCLGREARFNTPGTVGAQNWSWSMQPEQINDKVADSLKWLVGWSRRG